MESLLLKRWVRRWRQQRTHTAKRMMRDASDPLSLDHKLFVKHYRVTKELFVFVCTLLEDKLNVPKRCTSVPVRLKILTTISFLASGSYQKPVAQNWLVPLAQPTVSRCINEVVEALNQLMATYIQFPSTQEERNRVKEGFYGKFGVPGVIGCIDGTLIAIIRPRSHESEVAFYSYKGYYAINTAIICDSDLKIIGITARFGGASDDSHVWSSWSISSYLEKLHHEGEIGWLLGDSGYPQQPWLMTPVLHATEGTPESYYNDMHVQTHECVKRCIGLLTNRWRCLLSHRVLHYEPTKCAKIINACAVLHNFCINDGVHIDLLNDNIPDCDLDAEALSFEETTADREARQYLIDILWENHT